MRGSNLKFPSHYRKAPTRYAADSKKDAKARFVENAYHGLYSKNATANASECVRPRSSRPPATSLGALKEWAAWTLGIRNALLRVDGFGRDAYLHAPVGRDPSGPHRMWNLHAPANGLHDAPVEIFVGLFVKLMRRWFA